MQLMTMDVFLQQLANGLTLGSLYALIAIGYTMVYGILRLINFAHGEIFMMAMYLGYYLIGVFLIPWPISFLLVVLATMLLGMSTERFAYQPLRTQKAPNISLLISAIGASYLMQNLATVLFSGLPKNFPQINIFTDVITLGVVRMQKLSIVVPIITIGLTAAVLYVVRHTKSGMAMRAVSRDVETARLMGVNVDTTIALTFALGSGLAAIGALMYGVKYVSIIPTIGMMPGMKCFIAAVIGGIGNIKGAVLGGFLLGLIEIMIVAFFPTLNGYKEAFAYILLIVILLVKPTGILSETIAEKV